MKKVIEMFSFILILLGIILVGRGLGYGPHPEMIEKIDNMPTFDVKDADEELSISKPVPMVRIEEENGQFICSGTVISNKFVLTAAHCLAARNGSLRKDKLIIKSIATQESGEVLTVTSQAASRNSRADYGLITGDYSKFNKSHVLTDPREAIAVVGTLGPIRTCGFPWGAEDVCYPVGQGGHVFFEGIAVNGVLYPGMSGGPVLDMGRPNTVVAINSAVTDGGIIIMPLIGLFETLGVTVNNK